MKKARSPNPNPPAAPGPRVVLRIDAEIGSDAISQGRKARFGQRKILRPEPLLWTVNAAGPCGPEERVLDIHRDRHLDAAWGGLRRLNRGQADQTGPLGDRVAVASRNRQPTARARPKPPSLVALPPIPTRQREAPSVSTARNSAPKPDVSNANGWN